MADDAACSHCLHHAKFHTTGAADCYCRKGYDTDHLNACRTLGPVTCPQYFDSRPDTYGKGFRE